MSDTRIVEVNGVKLEIDLREARQVTSYKVGDKVRVLVKDYSSYAAHTGMIVGFDDFKNRPTIIVAYLDSSRYENPLKFVYINSSSEDIELAPLVDSFIAVEKSDILDHFEAQILKTQEKVKELEQKKRYFLKYFDAYFNECGETAS